MVEFMIQMGVNVNRKSKMGHTALHYAVDGLFSIELQKTNVEKNCKIVDLLLAQHPDISYDSCSRSPLAIAFIYGHIQVFEKLLFYLEKRFSFTFRPKINEFCEKWQEEKKNLWAQVINSVINDKGRNIYCEKNNVEFKNCYQYLKIFYRADPRWVDIYMDVKNILNRRRRLFVTENSYRDIMLSDLESYAEWNRIIHGHLDSVCQQKVLSFFTGIVDLNNKDNHLFSVFDRHDVVEDLFSLLEQIL